MIVINRNGKIIPGFSGEIQLFGETFGQRWGELVSFGPPWSMATKFSKGGGLPTTPLLVIMINAMKDCSRETKVKNIVQYFKEAEFVGNLFLNRHGFYRLLRLASVDEEIVLLTICEMAENEGIYGSVTLCSDNPVNKEYCDKTGHRPYVGEHDASWDYNQDRDLMRLELVLYTHKLFYNNDVKWTKGPIVDNSSKATCAMLEGKMPKRAVLYEAYGRLLCRLKDVSVIGWQTHMLFGFGNQSISVATPSLSFTLD